MWRNTADVINWYENAKNKELSTFIAFDIVNFYPSIPKNLLNKAIDFASKHVNFSEQELEIIRETKRSILFHNNIPWTKTNTNFDITMGSHDGAEACELVGLYLLSQLAGLGVPIGLYRDDGLAISNLTPQRTEV